MGTSVRRIRAFLFGSAARIRGRRHAQRLWGFRNIGYRQDRLVFPGHAIEAESLNVANSRPNLEPANAEEEEQSRRRNSAAEAFAPTKRTNIRPHVVASSLLQVLITLGPNRRYPEANGEFWKWEFPGKLA